MKFIIDGKVLSEKLKAVLMKGKWAQGNDTKSGSLGTSVIIEIGEIPYLYNGNESTYIRIRLTDIDIVHHGRCCVSYDLLNKYLKAGNVVIETLLEEGMLQLVTNTQLIKLPLLDRHPNNEQVLYSKENYTVDYNAALNNCLDHSGLPISEKTTLKTVLITNTENFINAMNACEVVGSGVYKLEYDCDTLTVSSIRNRESVSVTVDLEEQSGPVATVEFTGPIHKVIEGTETVLSFNDDSPIAILCRNIQMLRAPRVVDE